MQRPAAYWIEHLQLKRHPEGGYFSEVYRSSEQIPQSGLPRRFTGPRSMATSIFYLLEVGDFSAFHRIRSDETWHFYDGLPLEVHELHVSPQGIDRSDQHRVTLLGRDLEHGQRLQYTVPAGVWFASRPHSPGVPPGSTSSPGVPPGASSIDPSEPPDSSLPELAVPAGYSLVGCTVSPGFEFADFEIASRIQLVEQFPSQAALIEGLTQIN